MAADISYWVILLSSFFVRLVGALGLDFLTTVVLLLQVVDEVCRRTLTVVFAYESCCCALLPIRGGAESDLQAWICFCRLSFAVVRLSQRVSTIKTPEEGFQRCPLEENQEEERAVGKPQPSHVTSKWYSEAQPRSHPRV